MVRLDDGQVDLARSLALRLPGQSASRGHRDYSSRRLTDAITTAIALEQPFLEDGLHPELPPLLSHRQAEGLWRLTVSATLTAAEIDAIGDGWHEEATSRQRDIRYRLTEKDLSWHSPWRYRVALHLARQLLTGPSTSQNLRMLQDQATDFELLRSDLELSTDGDHDLVRDLGGTPRKLRGRGGSVVWRAERDETLDSFAGWITTLEDDAVVPNSYTFKPPTWTVTLPAGWRGCSIPFGCPPTPAQRQHLQEGKVVKMAVGSKSVLWPYGRDGAPIPNFQVVAGAVANLRPEVLIETVLLTQDEDLMSQLLVDADKAAAWGCISSDERQALIDRARTRNLAEIERLAETVNDHTVIRLREAAHDPARLRAIAVAGDIPLKVKDAGCRWRFGSIVDALYQPDISAEQLIWMTRAFHRYVACRILERDMEQAWRRAFWAGDDA